MLYIIYSYRPVALSLHSTYIYNIACDLDDSLFASVASFERFLFPTFSKAKTSGTVFTSTSITPAIYIPLFLSSLISKFLSSWVNKSLIFSL